MSFTVQQFSNFLFYRIGRIISVAVVVFGLAAEVNSLAAGAFFFYFVFDLLIESVYSNKKEIAEASKKKKGLSSYPVYPR